MQLQRGANFAIIEQGEGETMHRLQSDIAKGSAARVSVRFAPVPHLTCAKAPAAGIRSLFVKAIATVLCAFLALLFLTADASAEPDSAYCFDGEGTYYLMGNRNGVSLACREGSDTVTAVTGRLSEVTVCTRFTFRRVCMSFFRISVRSGICAAMVTETVCGCRRWVPRCLRRRCGPWSPRGTACP